MTLRTTALLVFAAIATLSFAAEIYTWTDANGIKHFSSTPPTTKQDAQTIVVEPLPAAADPAKAHARTMRQLDRQIEAVKALRSAQNPRRSTSSVAATRTMSDREYRQAREAITSAWQRKEINKAEEAALYLDLERKRFGLPSNRNKLAKIDTSNLDQLDGRARVIDGDTLDIDGIRIRLHGIDAVEKSQYCIRAYNRWPCGQEAATALAHRIGSTALQCRSRDRDKDDRIVAVCHAGSENLNAWMVRQGWAVAYTRYSRDYVEEENEARTFKRNIWSGQFVPPEAYRHANRNLSGE